MTPSRRSPGAAGHADDGITRMRLALPPRFASEVIELDDEDLAKNLYPVCSVDGCLRFLSTQQLCQTHLHPWNTRGQPDITDFQADPGRPTRPEKFDPRGLPPRLHIELALAIQLLATTPRERGRFPPQGIRGLIKTMMRLEDKSLCSEIGMGTTGRETIEVYLSRLLRLDLSPASRCYSLSSVAMVLRAARENGWDCRQLPGSTSETTLAGQPPSPAPFPSSSWPKSRILKPLATSSSRTG
jgi:hypothetical protein